MDEKAETSGLSRRTFIGASAAGAAGVLYKTTRGAKAVGTGATPSGKSVAILGGGVGGLSAAQELADRGFSVTVFEPKALGGKARSIPVPGTGSGGRPDLPGEHGFRFFPGFYQNLPETMSRIPFPGNAKGVYGNLVSGTEDTFARDGHREDFRLPMRLEILSPADIVRAVIAIFGEVTSLPIDELLFFGRQVLIYVTSSDARRYGQWEYTGWLDYVQAARMSEEYNTVLAAGLTRNLVAARPDLASTRTIGLMAEAFVLNIAGMGYSESPDRVLAGPTSEVWIDPWVTHLQSKGVQFRTGGAVALNLSGGKVQSATVSSGTGASEDVTADWFILAMPVEKAVPLMSPAIVAADPNLSKLSQLQTEWMNGIQFYLRRQVPIAHGHVSYVDSPWAVTSISQAQFWSKRFFPNYGDGSVRDCLSVDVSNWNEPGILFGKPANMCTKAEIAQEVWAQIKRSLNDTGRAVLTDSMLHSYFLDPAITPASGGTMASNSEPLLVNTVGSYDARPNARTGVPNLLLAADYVRTNIDLATMEGANEAARAAVSVIVHATPGSGRAVPVKNLYVPPEFEGLRKLDADRYKQGLPNLFDQPWPFFVGQPIQNVYAFLDKLTAPVSGLLSGVSNLLGP